MDTSETYIKMSWQARKYIKKAWNKFSDKQRLGTLICFRSFMGMIVNTEPKKFKGLISVIPETMALREWCNPENEDLRTVEVDQDFDDEGFPLLRQDQIQEMIPSNIPQAYRSDYGEPFQTLEYFFYTISSDGYGGGHAYEDCYKQFTSMEQLWLAFYMFKKYNKIWSGTKWGKR